MRGDEFFLFSDFSDFSNIFEITENAEARNCVTAVITVTLFFSSCLIVFKSVLFDGLLLPFPYTSYARF